MEIEAKFRVPDDETFERLEEAVELGSFAVSPGRVIDLDDRYLDTDDYRVLAAGYFCRRRESLDGIVMTFKSLDDGDGAVHRREEVSVRLEADGPPVTWPDGPARELALRLTGDRPLETLFVLRQQRLERAVAHGGRTVAELALDRVTIDTRRGSQSFLECEIELRPAGIERDLQELVTVVQQRWHLDPVADSKFARGLALATGVPLGRAEDWRRELRRLRVQRWARQARDETQAARPVGAGTPPPGAEHPEPGAPEARPPEARPTVSVQPDIERGGAQEAAVGMRALFERRAPDSAAEAWTGARELFEPTVPGVEAAEPEVAAVPQPKTVESQPETAEPEAIEPLVAEPEVEKPGPQAEEPGVSGPGLVAVEASAAEAGEPEAVGPQAGPEAVVAEETVPEGAVTETLEPEAGPEAPAPEEAVLGTPQGAAEMPAPEAGAAEAEEPEPEAAEREYPTPEGGDEAGLGKKKERARPGIVSDDTMDEAARKTLLSHYERMLKHEPGTREGEDAEELHDMRVATRRMRAAMRVFDGYLDRDVVKPYLKALRRTGRSLGTVRDLDVFNEKTQRYLDGLGEGRESDLDPLLAAWRTERDRARIVMIDYLDSQGYERFTRRFGEFLQKPGAAALEPFNADGEPLPRLVRDVLPVVLFERLATVRAFDGWLDAPDVPLTRYHRLRIASKGLRYTLEFFEEVLGPDARPLIEDVKTLQDHLGDLQDAVVGCGVASAFLTWGTWQAAGTRCPGPAHPVLNAPGVATYLAQRQQEIATLIGSFPPVWERVRGPGFARGVAELVAAI